jgi:N-acyl-phosphatidylethanolamine-hydrolysing phospholipase D
MDMIKWKLFNRKQTNLPENEEELNKSLPVHYVTDEQISEFFKEDTRDKIRVLWVGHATSIINMENCIILVDPVFSQKRKRYRPVPITIDRIPKLDAVILSHNHYDHLDYHSVKSLNEKFGNKGNESVHWLVGVGMASWFKSCNIEHNVHEFTWWQWYKLKTLKFTFTPSQHWCGRGVNDYNTVNNNTIYYNLKLIEKKKNNNSHF